MTSLTALVLTPRRAEEIDGRGAAAMMAAPEEGRAAAGAEADARATAECIDAGFRGKWGSAGAVGGGSAGWGTGRDENEKGKGTL